MSKIERMVRFPEVLEKFGLARSTVCAKMAAGTFPKARKLSPKGRAVGWFEVRAHPIPGITHR